MPQYSTRAQHTHRPTIAPSVREKVFAETGGVCFYCGWVAESVDHIIPYSYGGTDDLYNLVACCLLCNHVAHNKIFDDVELKRDYILGEYLRRKVYAKRRRQLSLCTDCGKLFRPRWQGSTLFVCGRCNGHVPQGFTTEERATVARLNKQIGERRARYG